MAESPGEEFLKERGLIQRRSNQRQRLLGCLGCRWSKASEAGSKPGTYGFEITQCTGIPSGVIYPLLRSLKEAGVVESAWDVAGANATGIHPRKLFVPSPTDLGEAFAASLPVPDECPLENQG